MASEHQDVDTVVAKFDGAPGVRARLEALAGPTSSLVLFSEYVPHPLSDWLTDPLERAELSERRLFDIVAILRSRELLHLDGHFANMRAVDDRVHLVDFGLATSPRFDLSPPERDFAARNVAHDADYPAMRLVNWLATAPCAGSRLRRPQDASWVPATGTCAGVRTATSRTSAHASRRTRTACPTSTSSISKNT